MIYKKSSEEIAVMRRGGAILAETLNRLEEALLPGITTGELDAIAEMSITSQGAKPSFKGYRGFPASICTSPNHVIVHGIPGPLVLEEGDIVSLD
ncbi:MAG: M24 family metallopeptidase, partial [Actinobacteria bacterium]|nr:M24 family metallopeptidase [Actinomycetota bacterium]